MKIVVTANGTGLEALVSPLFGRCPALVLVDTDTMRFEAMENPEGDILRGAGVEVAQFIIERGAQAVLTGHVGPLAFGVLQASGVQVCLFEGGTVREAAAAYKSGQLEPVREADVPTHSGTGGGSGMGRGGRTLGEMPSVPSAPFASPQEEIAALKETAEELRDRLAQVSERLDQLQDENQG